MANPQQPELRRSEENMRPRPDQGPDPQDVGGDGGPVPPDNRPGHHPDHEQDKPPADKFAAALGIKPDTEVGSETPLPGSETSATDRTEDDETGAARSAAAEGDTGSDATDGGTGAGIKAASGKTGARAGAGKAAGGKTGAKTADSKADAGKDSKADGGTTAGGSAGKGTGRRSSPAGATAAAGTASGSGETSVPPSLEPVTTAAATTFEAGSGAIDLEPSAFPGPDAGGAAAASTIVAAAPVPEETAEQSAVLHHHALPDRQLPHDTGFVLPGGTPVTGRVVLWPLQLWGRALKTTGSVICAYGNVLRKVGEKIAPDQR